MYRAFNLINCDWSKIPIGDAAASNKVNESIVKNALQTFLNSNGKLDGTKMREHWFPKINANVFISHSHGDRDDAIKLAGFLKSLGLNSFIDSCVWGYAGDLLKEVDNNYCKNKKDNTFIYEKLNLSASHIHMMLSTALSMMIDTVECVIFMNTPKSITYDDTITKKTQSPWIYYELSMMSLIRRRKLEDYRPKLMQEKMANFSLGSLPFEYTVSLGDLAIMDANILKQWKNEWKSPFGIREEVLDILYRLVKEPLKKTKEFL